MDARGRGYAQERLVATAQAAQQPWHEVLAPRALSSLPLPPLPLVATLPSPFPLPSPPLTSPHLKTSAYELLEHLLRHHARASRKRHHARLAPPWRRLQDRTNQTEKYERNRIRNMLVALEQVLLPYYGTTALLYDVLLR